MQAKLKILDEVNVKIEGLELTLRKRLVDKFKYEIPGAKYQPSVRLGRWDGKVSFFNLGGTTFINLLPDIIPILEAHNYDVELDDCRTYSTTFNFDPVTMDSYKHISWPKTHPLAGQPIELRDYQIDVINKFLSNPQCLQEVATGAGKTIVTAALSERVQGYGRTIVIVPNKSLVTQTEADYINMGLDVGVLFGDRKDYFKQHTICTWQSLLHLLKNTQNAAADVTIQDFLEGVVCVMVDEAHSAKADGLKSLLSGIFARVPIRWGLTGTVPKEDYAAQALFCCIGPLIGKLSAKELQDMGHLSECQVNVVQLVDYVEYKNYQDELRYLIENTDRLDAIAGLIMKINDAGNTLVLIDRVSPGRELVNRLGDKATFISGSTKATTRKEHYDEVADATNKILVCTYGVAAVGINVPRLFNVVMIEPGKSFVRVIQSIGRGLRKAEDKNYVNIYDITSTCKFAKRHLQKRKQFYKDANYPISTEKYEWQK